MCVTFYLSIYGWTLGLSHLIFSEGTEVLSRSGHPITYWEAGSERLSLPPPRPKTLLQAAEHDTLLLQVLLWFQIVKMTTTESHIALNYIPGTVRSTSCMLTHFLITTRPVR